MQPYKTLEVVMLMHTHAHSPHTHSFQWSKPKHGFYKLVNFDNVTNMIEEQSKWLTATF